MVELNFVLTSKNLEQLGIRIDVGSCSLTCALVLDLWLLKPIRFNVLPESSNNFSPALFLDTEYSL